MATGLSTSIIGGSEEGFDTCCSPCADRGISKEAQKYCADCCINYCEQCIQIHNKIPLAQGHQIVDKSGQAARSARTALPTERCVIHHGKLVDMFCADHDMVCCSACIAVKHRTCVKVEYLPEVSRGIRDSQEFRDVNNSLDEMLNKLEKEKTLASLENDKSSINEEITRVEEELRKKITEMAQQARTELLAKYNEERKVIEGDIKTVEDIITKIALGQNTLKDDNDVQLFVNVKGGQIIVKDGQTLLSAISKTGNRKCLTFMPNKDLQQLAQQLNLLASICITDEASAEDSAADVREYTAKLQGKYKVNGTQCTVTSVCILDDTTVLIFDNTNKHLKRLNITDFNVVDQLKMENDSYSVCKTGSQEVAIALYNKTKIQFVSVAGTMTMTRSFSTNHTCYRMTFNEITGELFVSNNSNKVNVYDKTGNKLKSYVYCDKGIPFFNRAGSIALSDDQTTIFITDFESGMLALDKSPSLRWKFSDQELQNADDVCVLPGNVILVTGYKSHNIIQVDKHGNKVRTLLGAGDNLNNPQALPFHRKSYRLIVGHGSNEIFVYKLSPK